jgi:hypothetical protein
MPGRQCGDAGSLIIHHSHHLLAPSDKILGRNMQRLCDVSYMRPRMDHDGDLFNLRFCRLEQSMAPHLHKRSMHMLNVDHNLMVGLAYVRRVMTHDRGMAAPRPGEHTLEIS